MLTETDSRVHPKHKNCFSTVEPEDKNNYKPTETRVSIFTKYDCVKHYDTFDKHTAVCVELNTEIGNLIVYGTIIGVYGNRCKSFIHDLNNQINDIDLLAKENNFCIIGDFNCSFADNYYFTQDGREKLEDAFTRNSITLLTREQPECIDHIAISNNFLVDLSTDVSEWNIDKKLSDHKGVIVELRR